MMTWAFLLLVPSFLFLTFDQISLIAILFVYKLIHSKILFFYISLQLVIHSYSFTAIAL